MTILSFHSLRASEELTDQRVDAITDLFLHPEKRKTIEQMPSDETSAFHLKDKKATDIADTIIDVVLRPRMRSLLDFYYYRP